MARAKKHVTLEAGVVGNVPLEQIDLDPEQPRTDIDATYITELAADIKVRGVLQPITLRTGENGRYIIKYGECRYRASCEAGVATIPAILDDESNTSADPLARLLDQVKENHIRRNLNPMEWARVLRRMRDDHKIKKMADIEDTLRANGITNMGRSQISNLMRLADLPEWAQQRIKTGELTASHGKYLLQASIQPDVLEALRADIEADPSMGVRALQELMFDHFIRLPNSRALAAEGAVYTPHITFDYKTECAGSGCQKMARITTEDRAATFCLDRECWMEKDAAARARATSTTTAPARDDTEPGAPTAHADAGATSEVQQTIASNRRIQHARRVARNLFAHVMADYVRGLPDVDGALAQHVNNCVLTYAITDAGNYAAFDAYRPDGVDEDASINLIDLLDARIPNCRAADIAAHWISGLPAEDAADIARYLLARGTIQDINDLRTRLSDLNISETEADRAAGDWGGESYSADEISNAFDGWWAEMNAAAEESAQEQAA
jgi:ParB/RepB/Spo0J family partition protein